MAKILRVNLSDLKTNIEDLPMGHEGLGGRALTSAIVSKEVVFDVPEDVIDAVSAWPR